MRKNIWLPLMAALALVLLLCACGADKTVATAPATAPTETTAPPETTPPDGDPNDVTCKGSYTGTVTPGTVVAKAGEQTLTAGELQVWYWAAVAQYRQENHPQAPDFDRPLDVQVCDIDSSVNSWQQYFLRSALNSWYTARMMMVHSETVPMPTEEAYKPDWDAHAERMEGMPATQFLYGHNVYYMMNTMHQAYLESVPETLAQMASDKGYGSVGAMAQAVFGTDEKSLTAYIDTLNRGYMYFTALAYYVEPTQEELDAFYTANQANYTETGKSVDIRHILLVPQDIVEEPVKKWGVTEPTEPVILEKVEIAADGTVTCSEEAWAICEADAQGILTSWRQTKLHREAEFADLANKHSADTGTALDGGAYRNIRQGQLMKELDDWCFDPQRQVGDVEVIRSAYGIHILYFCASRDVAAADAEADYIRTHQNALLEEARKLHPLEVTYSAITLAQGEGTVSTGDLLYPDVAHERFPEVPLYLQQDYPDTMYGYFPIRTYGCGITTMAMLATYMADDELTPPELCERFGNYCFYNGTDGSLFSIEPSSMDFYCRAKTYNCNEAKAALEEGQIVISVQHKGYWTRGGHYIVLEKIFENDMVQVRDSNIFNYTRLPAHKNDQHKWVNITTNGAGFWIYEDKITRIPACSRCGQETEIVPAILQEEYGCHKCATALTRRNTYLSGFLSAT